MPTDGVPSLSEHHQDFVLVPKVTSQITCTPVVFDPNDGVLQLQWRRDLLNPKGIHVPAAEQVDNPAFFQGLCCYIQKGAYLEIPISSYRCVGVLVLVVP